MNYLLRRNFYNQSEYYKIVRKMIRSFPTGMAASYFHQPSKSHHGIEKKNVQLNSLYQISVKNVIRLNEKTKLIRKILVWIPKQDKGLSVVSKLPLNDTTTRPPTFLSHHFLLALSDQFKKLTFFYHCQGQRYGFHLHFF